MKKLVVKIGTILLLFICMVSCGSNVSAQESTDYFSFATSNKEAYQNDEIRISILANEVDLKENIAGFRFTVNYDATKLTLKRVDTSSQMTNNTFRYHINGDCMTGIYVCDGTSAPKLSGECLTLIFRVNQDAVLGETSISAQIDQVVDWSANPLSSVSGITSVIALKPEFKREAVLSKLAPNHGTLEPAFDPYVQEYSLTVGAEVDQILFDLEAADGGTARVNRKNLGKQGSVTPFIVTVVSADKKNQSQYLINVNRLEKDKKATASSGKSGASKPKAAGKGKSGGTTNDHHKEDDVDGEHGAAQTVFYGDRNLYVVGNQMPAYVIYMIIGGAAIALIGITVAILILVRKKKR